MIAKGYERDFAEKTFSQLEGFGSYGFPESHAASFALIAYASSYLKCYYPAAFTAALLNSQPMGFYSPGSLVRDAKDHGVETREVSIVHSEWDSTLEESGEACRIESTAKGAKKALRLGFRLIKGFGERAALAVVGVGA